VSRNVEIGDNKRDGTTVRTCRSSGVQPQLAVTNSALSDTVIVSKQQRLRTSTAGEEGRRIVERMGGYSDPGAHELLERDHELRASLFGIEAVALALNEQRDRLPSGDVDQLALAIASEARRLRLMLAPRAKQRTAFDLAEAIRPAILMARSLGVVVREAVPAGTCVQGCRDDTAQVVLALLDNARVHAAPSEVDIRATSRAGTTTLYVEDRGPGITGDGGQAMFERGRPGAHGSGLGLFIARRLMVELGGSLRVDPRPGGGASFALSLPSSSSGSTERLPAVALQTTPVVSSLRSTPR
jgi:signal transduction histidine kinase